MSSALAGGFFTTEPPGKPPVTLQPPNIIYLFDSLKLWSPPLECQLQERGEFTSTTCRTSSRPVGNSEDKNHPLSIPRVLMKFWGCWKKGFPNSPQHNALVTVPWTQPRALLAFCPPAAFPGFHVASWMVIQSLHPSVDPPSLTHTLILF